MIEKRCEDREMFTFIVTCYNQADVVLEALESIRYQIERFGGDQKFQLIVTDDASTDESQEVIRQWMSVNKELFVKTGKIFREKNMGICRNYVDALKHAAGERFVVLNGDDLLAPDNLFEITDRLRDYDIVCTAFIKFTGFGEMICSHNTYLEVVLQEIIARNCLHWVVKLGCPVMGTAVYRKSLLTKEVYDFILRYRTVNDRACFQKILEENKDIRVCYVNRPMVLYRISEHSISNFHSPARLLHNREIAKLCRAAKAAEPSVRNRMMISWQEKSAYVRTSPNYFVRLLRFLSPYYFIMLWLYMRNYGEIKRMERQLIDPNWVNCRDHYKKIQTNVRKYLNRNERGNIKS